MLQYNSAQNITEIISTREMCLVYEMSHFGGWLWRFNYTLAFPDWVVKCPPCCNDRNVEDSRILFTYLTGVYSHRSKPFTFIQTNDIMYYLPSLKMRIAESNASSHSVPILNEVVMSPVNNPRGGNSHSGRCDRKVTRLVRSGDSGSWGGSSNNWVLVCC